VAAPPDEWAVYPPPSRSVTGLVADASLRTVRARRALALLAMATGALAGGVLLRFVAIAAPLWLAAAALLTCAGAAYRSARSPHADAWR
jgi:predicted MFS family arabinose efflux permease